MQAKALMKRVLWRIERTIWPPDPLPVFDSAHSKAFWATREDETPSVQGYWEGRSHPGRALVAETVADLPGTSVLEVGVHAGPTLWAIAQAKNYARLAGTELSSTVLDFTREHLPAALGRDVELVQAPADKLPFPDKSFDVTVTNLVLVCIGPDDIETSLAELLRVTKGYLVFAEPQAASAPADKADLFINTTYWVRNYARLLGDRATLVRRVPVPKDKQYGHLDEIAVFQLTGA